MNKKNGGIIPHMADKRLSQINVPCGQCYICRKKKAREWRMRISEDIKENPNCKIVLLTFSTESLIKLTSHEECKGLKGYELDNKICKIAVKYFRERWRKKYGRSIRHWLITELGHGKTEHVHIHGILWQDNRYILEDEFLNEVQKIWQYGWVGRGKKNWQTGKYENYVNDITANYFTKYVNKVDKQHEEYKQIILTSAGIGKGFINSERAKNNTYRGKDTNLLYYMEDGGTLPMPQYFKYKLYTEEEREQLNLNYIKSPYEWIDGKEVRKDITDQERKKIYDAMKSKNARLGYNNYNYIEKSIKKLKENERRKKIHEKRFLKEVAPQALRGLGIAPESAESVISSLRSLGAELEQWQKDINKEIAEKYESKPYNEIQYKGEWVPEWVAGQTTAIQPSQEFEKRNDEF